MSLRHRAFAAVLLLSATGAGPAQESAPASRPGGLIAFTRAGNVWVIGADGRNERQLTEGLQYDRPITWTADGRRVIYWTHPEDWHLWSVDVESGAKRDLTPEGGDCRSAMPSPDSKLVAFMSGRDGLSVADAQGSNRRVLSKLGHRDAPPAWSPDGSRLAFVHLYPAGERHIDLDVYLVGKDGGEADKLVPSAEDPSWSRDGRTIYCIARRGSRPDLYAFDVTTRTEKNLTSTPDVNEASLAVSPDGRRIAVVAWDAGWKSCELRVLDAGGSGLKTLAKLEGRPALPSWSPDSTRIAIDSGPDSRPNLLVIDAASGQSTQLTREGASWAAWQPR
jgi:Tol biopolymer transport system component